MNKLLRWGAVAAAAAAICVLGVGALHYLEAEAGIRAHYPLRNSTVRPLDSAAARARGAHLVRILGCADCHGADLRGRAVTRGDVEMFAPPLALPADGTGDSDFARATRFGLNPDGTSLWMMPSASYVYLREADLDAIVAYVHAQPANEAAPAARFGEGARGAIRRGDIEASAQAVLSEDSPLDPGPRYEGGRYLARIACAECHGLDLEGVGEAPSLTAIGGYSAHDFFALLHEGRARNGAHTAVMTHVARARFRYLADYETLALYEYLYVRAQLMGVTLR